MASNRNYISQAEVQEYANITITDSDEGDERISIAEELIDSYVGPQQKAFTGWTGGTAGVYTPPDFADMPKSDNAIFGKATAGGASTITLEGYQQNVYQQDYFALCMVEIIGGTGAGQRLPITGSTLAGVITVQTAWATAPDSTSLYKIYQLGRFPRMKDVFFNSRETPARYYKSIPEAVKRAVCAQVEYMIQMGDNFFAGESSRLAGEHIDNYSYRRNSNSHENLIAPKAQMYLRGIRNKKGQIIV